MKRPLFVFAGQSNMMGAAVLEATGQIHYKNSFEYLHKPRRLGASSGDFKNYGFPTGEFSYIDLSAAYGNNKSADKKSQLADYQQNTYFCPSMCNFKDAKDKSVYSFAKFSEASNRHGVSLAPFIVKNLEEAGFYCAYTHIAKGGVPIKHFLEGDAAEYFSQKVNHFFEDSEKRFCNDDTTEKVLVWLQGESDAGNTYEYYLEGLNKLWNNAKSLGFTRFMVVRVDFFGNLNITEIMRAQEDFCRTTENAYIITRVASFFDCCKTDNHMTFTKTDPEFDACRDSFYGYANEHINEKGFKVIAKYATPNIIRIIFEGKEPILEEEIVEPLVNN